MLLAHLPNRKWCNAAALSLVSKCLQSVKLPESVMCMWQQLHQQSMTSANHWPHSNTMCLFPFPLQSDEWTHPFHEGRYRGGKCLIPSHTLSCSASVTFEPENLNVQHSVRTAEVWEWGYFIHCYILTDILPFSLGWSCFCNWLEKSSQNWDRQCFLDHTLWPLNRFKRDSVKKAEAWGWRYFIPPCETYIVNF